MTIIMVNYSLLVPCRTNKKLRYYELGCFIHCHLGGKASQNSKAEKGGKGEEEGGRGWDGIHLSCSTIEASPGLLFAVDG